jgi:hypothetical protein
MSIPGFGPIAASAMAAIIQDTFRFAGPREFAAVICAWSAHLHTAIGRDRPCLKA